RLRDTESRAVVAGIKTWLTTQAVLPRSSLGEAIGYALRHWEGLERFLSDARIPLDTNAVERGHTRSFPRSIRSPPIASRVHPAAPPPAAPPAPAPPVRTCSVVPWLHPLKQWSLRQSRGGSVPPCRQEARQVACRRA